MRHYVRFHTAAALAVCLALASGCANFLGIEDLSEGGSSGADAGAPADAPSGQDGSPMADAGGEPADAMPAPLTAGFPMEFEGTSTLTDNMIWAMDIDITQPTRLDRYGIILARGLGASDVVQIGLYTAPPPATPGEPATLVRDSVTELTPLPQLRNEIDIGNIELLPGRYWIAVSFREPVEIKASRDDAVRAPLHFAGHGFGEPFPDEFVEEGVELNANAMNLYLVLAP